MSSERKTAIRAGGGQFFQRELVARTKAWKRVLPSPWLQAPTVRGFGNQLGLHGHGLHVGAGLCGWIGFAELRQSRACCDSQQLAVQRHDRAGTPPEYLPANRLLGNTGVHLTSMQQFNGIGRRTGRTQCSAEAVPNNPWRPALNFGPINGFARAGHASYNSLRRCSALNSVPQRSGCATPGSLHRRCGRRQFLRQRQPGDPRRTRR